MDRRTFLAAAGGSVSILSGCASLDVADPLSVVFHPSAYLAGAAEASLRPEEITPEAEIPEALLDPLRRARDGVYVTNEVDEALLEAVDVFRDPKDNYRLETPPIRLDGSVYAFEARVPTLVVKLADETAEGVDREAVFHRQKLSADDNGLSPVAIGFVDRISYRGPNAPRLVYRASAPPAPVENFVDTYEYVEDSQGVSRIVAEWRHADSPDEIEVRPLSARDLYDRPVVEISRLPAEVSAFVSEVIGSSRDRPAIPYVTDSIPDGFFDRIKPTDDYRRNPFIWVDETLYSIGIAEAGYGRAPVEVTATSRPPGDAGRDRFQLRVAAAESAGETELADSTIELFGTVGLPSVLRIDDGDEFHLLRSESYEYPVDADVSDGSATAAALVLTVQDRDIELLAAEESTRSVEWTLELGEHGPGGRRVTETLAIGEEIAATCEISDTVPPGTYRCPGLFGVRWEARGTDDRVEEIVPFEVDLAIEVS